MNLSKQKLSELKGAVNHCLLSYVDNFVDDSIQADSKENDNWIWQWDNEAKTLHMSVRGTDELADVLKDISIYPKRLKGVGYACAGFLEGAEKVIDYTLSQFLNAHDNGFKITLSGHSYGGAIVQIMQQILRVEHNITTSCVSFGSPRIWLPFASPKGRHLRVHIETDPITYLPFFTGHVMRIYKHRASEHIELEKEGWFMKPQDHYLTTYQSIIEELMANHNYSSKYFTPQELVPPAIYEQLGVRAYCLFESKVLQQLDRLRADYGKSLKINDWHNGGGYSESGLREISTTTGAKKSAHKLGYAFDLKHYDGSSLQPLRDFIKAKGETYGIKRVENFDKTPTWIHIELTADFVKETYYFNP